MPKVSICIPYHDTPKTAFYLSRLLHSISTQNFTDYEIVLTKEGKMARNLNAAIIKSKGEVIHLLGMDDYFSHPGALGKIVSNIGNNPWQVTACLHDRNGVLGNLHTPLWTDDIYQGNNRLGGIAVLSMRRDNALLFEEPLQWMVDCELYYRLYLKYGLPILNVDYGVVIGVDEDSMSNTILSQLKQDEVNYVIKKYGK